MANYVNGRATFSNHLHEEISLHERLAKEQKTAIECLQAMVLQLNGGELSQPPGDLLLSLGWRRTENIQSIYQWVDPLNGQEVTVTTALVRAFLRYRDHMEKPSLYAQLINDDEEE